MANITSIRKTIILILAVVVVLPVIGAVSFFTYLRWMSLPRPANYDAMYEKANKGKVQVEIPEVYELANIAIAITDFGLENPNAARKGGKYHERVQKHFLPYKEHPLLARIEFSRGNSFLRYFGFRENAARYCFDGDSIVPNGLYPRSWAWFPDLFKKNIALVEDFARASGFREFYKENRPYYEEQVQRYKETVPLRRIWQWLEKNFPQRYDTYKVIFSPLIWGSHSTQRCKSNGFKEVIAFVSGPDTSARSSGKVHEGLLSRVVFTEIDHNYVNPTSWSHWFRIGGAFHRTEQWNRQSNYRNPVATFNEYMTWAVFLLYARDTYRDQDFEEIKRITVDNMVNRRKFVLFDEFINELLQLYQGRDEGQTMPDLYPGILAWAEEVGSRAGTNDAKLSPKAHRCQIPTKTSRHTVRCMIGRE